MLDGIFAVVKSLFNVVITERVDKVDVWHKDVRFFDVYDLDISDTEPVGSFYFDAYIRDDSKVSANRNSGWTLLIRNKSEINQNKALTSVIFNLQPPGKDGTPSMLTFKAVQALFENVSLMMTKLQFYHLFIFKYKIYESKISLSNNKFTFSSVMCYNKFYRERDQPR